MTGVRSPAMAIEIEWKFLVTKLPGAADDVARDAGARTDVIDQGYFSVAHGPAVRVRLKGGRASLDVKAAAGSGSAAAGPQVCREFSWEIPRADAEALLALAPWRIRKTRHTFPSGIELDVFEGPHAGLVVAEFETDDAAAGPPEPPPGWEWRDVSRDLRYVNRALAEHGVPPA
ncbi:MAG: hypothetical protein HMLKMBBP_02441 [Planctomycetes bacterium]|nr:hypothetical protein [Planctomycetota bacterium]